MRNKKLVILTMAACMTTGLVAGCGAKSADTATPAETAAESSAAAEESGAEETEALAIPPQMKRMSRLPLP